MSGPTRESVDNQPPSTTYGRLGPLTFRTGSEHAEAVKAGIKPITEAEAQAGAQAQQAAEYVDENYGAAGKLAAGVGSGLTLGLGPGIASRMGLMDPNTVGALEASGLYGLGDVAGTVLPALVSGGASLEARGLGGLGGAALRATPAGILESVGSGTERYLGRLLGAGEVVGGQLLSKPLQMAARGAVEGAAINLGHNVGQQLLTNEPLSAESMAAAGMDGALFGGLIGGGLGTVGALGSSAVDSLSKFGAAGKGATSSIKEGVVARRLGMSADTVAEAKAAEGLPAKFKGYQEQVLDKAGYGSKIGSKDEAIVRDSVEAKKLWGTERTASVEALDKEAQHLVPSYERLMGRLETEIVAPRIGSAGEAEAHSFVQKMADGLENLKPSRTIPIEVEGLPSATVSKPGVGPYGPKEEFYPKTDKYSLKEEVPVSTSWKNWIKTRDSLEAGLNKDLSNPLLATTSQFKKELLNAVDSEIAEAMKAALPESAQKYAAATTGIRMAEELESMVGSRAAKKLLSTEPALTARDGALLGVSALTGSPAAGLGWLAAKGLSRKFSGTLEPALAQMAYDSMTGAKALSATSQTQGSIKESVAKFFSSAAKATPKIGYSAQAERRRGGYKSPDSDRYSRKAYEDNASRTEQLLSSNHQEKVRRYSEELGSMGYVGLGGQIQDVNNRAVQYLMLNMPARRGTQNLKSLRPMPVPKGLDMGEFKFLRIDRAIKNPLSVLEDLSNGSISRDAVKAVKYVYPELHSEMVASAAEAIYEMKSQGKFLPMDKIASLGIALDAPIDSTLEKDFVAGVQQALHAPKPGAKPDQPPPVQMGRSDFVNSAMTPLEQVAYT